MVRGRVERENELKQIRWGMIGCGAVTRVKSAPAYSLVPGFRLAAVASRRSDAAAEYAAAHGVEHAFASPEELIRSPHVDAVYIATPPSSHLSLALEVAKAGKPCCVEKPIATSHAQAVRMVQAFDAAVQPLFVAYYRRSLPRFGQVKRWLEDSLIGEVRHVHWTLMRTPTRADLAGDTGWRTDVREAPGGYFDDLACHGLDLFDWLVGPIAEAGGSRRNQAGLYGAPDAVTGAWVHEGGATGSGGWNFAAAARSDEVRIIGARGEIGFSVFDEAPLVLKAGTDARTVEVPNPAPIQLHHVENMARHLSEGTPHPSLGASAARTARVMDAMLGIGRGPARNRCGDP